MVLKRIQATVLLAVIEEAESVFFLDFRGQLFA